MITEIPQQAVHLDLANNTVAELDKMPEGFLPFEDFVSQFALLGTSTEQVHEKTKALSDTMQTDVVKGLEMLLDADQAVVDGFESFIPVIRSLAPELAVRMRDGGRIFLVGSGSSGRVALDLAARCYQNSSVGKEQIRGVIAGGDSALIRAKEGFEDSESAGKKCLERFDLKKKDTVFLVSASGSAVFNVACGHFAANKGASAFIFYNSKDIPSRTKQLFSRQNNQVIPLELDIGPQAISGSTRLQAASLAKMCLGGLLGSVLLHYEGRAFDADKYPCDLAEKMRKGNGIIARHLNAIAQLVQKEAAVFLSPNANLRRLQDETTQGYVTLIGDKKTIPTVVSDVTEIPPTFSTNPIRKEEETFQKRSEVRAYLVEEEDNFSAWETLLGRSIEEEDIADTKQFGLAIGSLGNHSYDKRPTGSGNFVMGVTKITDASEDISGITSLLQDVLEKGGGAGIIILSRDKIAPFLDSRIATLFLEEIPFDHLGIVETVLLKQVLNLISNGSMILAGKVQGNRMIDVSPSNQKLIGRSLRLIKDIWKDSRGPIGLSDEELYRYIVHVCALKKSFANLGIYTPSATKVVLGLVYLEKEPSQEGFQGVLDFLAERQEKLDFLSIGNGPFTLCIDGGGSKTLLQIIDGQGRIVPMSKEENWVHSVESGASNINVVQEEGVRAALNNLFHNTKIGQQKRDIQEVLSSSRVVAGMAGVGMEKNFAAVTAIFEQMGICKENLTLLTDVEVALGVLEGDGVVLISGTGSSCFAKKNGKPLRIRGYGPILGDEGSGYQIGKKAIIAVLDEVFDSGEKTSLTPALVDFFNMTERSQLKNLLRDVTSFKIPSATVASISRLVFEKAAEQDPVAQEIISQINHELCLLVERALKFSELANCELALWGGVFKDCLAEQLIEKIREKMAPRGMTVINRSSENAAVLFAQRVNKKS